MSQNNEWTGQRILEFRRKHRLYQRELAALLDVNPRTIRWLESNKCRPNLENQRQLDNLEAELEKEQ